jgi:hypothetical protein
MGELWDNCPEFTKVMAITIICFPFIPILLLYWFLHSEQIRNMWVEAHNEEETTERSETPVEIQRLRDRIDEAQRYWVHLRTRFFSQYGLSNNQEESEIQN